MQTGFEFADNLKFTCDYNRIYAYHSHARSTGFWGGGETRGDLVVGRLDFTLNPRLSGHLVWEWFDPGNYYFDGADNYSWARFELIYRCDWKL